MPPSVNGLFAGKARRFKSKKYKEWIDLAEKELSGKLDKISINPEVWLKARIECYFPLYCKNGNPKKKDVANYEKAATDFLADRIQGFEDMMIIDNRQIKIDSDRNELVYTLEEVNL